MTGQAVVAAPRLTLWWLRTYTRGLPTELRERRREEIASDVHEQLAEADGPRAVRGVVGRTTRGLRRIWAATTQAWFAPASALLFVFDVAIAIAIAIATEDAGKAPGNVVGPVLLLALGLCLASGLLMRVAEGRGAGPAATWRGRTTLGAATALALLVLLGMVGVGGPTPTRRAILA